MTDNKKSIFNPGLLVSLFALAFLGILAWLHQSNDSTAIHVAYLMAQAVVISIVIWQVCDPFADAAQWIGSTFRIPGSVRGATLDAVASSMPELFSGIFFVVVAFMAADESGVAQAGGDGFGSTIATCAGSAVYNMILIPAVCVIVISFARKSRPTIDIDSKVISRDGMWFLCCEILLIAFLFLDRMSWWMAIVLLLAYAAYVVKLYLDARQFRSQLESLQASIAGGLSADEAIRQAEQDGKKVSRDLAGRLTEGETEDDDDEPESAAVFFGLFEIPLNHVTSWAIIGIATLLAAAACYWLVEVTHDLATTLGVPVFFVAVIIAAAASSVPDTFLSVASAKRGDDDGAVSNAFGSNIFDITICLSIPLLIGCYLNNWQPIELTHNGEPIRGLLILRILLCVFSLVTLLIMWHRRQLTRGKAYFLCFLYALFILYAVAGSMGWI